MKGCGGFSGPSRVGSACHAICGALTRGWLALRATGFVYVVTVSRYRAAIGLIIKCDNGCRCSAERLFLRGGGGGSMFFRFCWAHKSTFKTPFC